MHENFWWTFDISPAHVGDQLRYYEIGLSGWRRKVKVGIVVWLKNMYRYRYFFIVTSNTPIDIFPMIDQCCLKSITFLSFLESFTLSLEEEGWEWGRGEEGEGGGVRGQLGGADGTRHLARETQSAFHSSDFLASFYFFLHWFSPMRLSSFFQSGYQILIFRQLHCLNCLFPWRQYGQNRKWIQTPAFMVRHFRFSSKFIIIHNMLR